jgi:OOP family OmpA-OmpF porin
MPRALAAFALCLAFAVPAGALAQEHYHVTGSFPEQAVDTDRDGTVDIDDNCPATPPMQLVRGKPRPVTVDHCGCPIDPCTLDGDKDAINDCDDICPGTAPQIKVGVTGCPQPQKRPQSFKLDVKFAFAQANLQDRFVPDLDSLKVLLLKLPELTVTLEGHTDSVGSDGYNRALSEARARKCRDYLLQDPRISADRVRAVGYGESSPVASNDTEEGRAQNRRTVATLDYLYEFTPPNDGSLPVF